MHVFPAEAKVFKPCDVINSKLGSSPWSSFEVRVALVYGDEEVVLEHFSKISFISDFITINSQIIREEFASYAL